MKVTLRKKKLKDGRFSFYLDIYHQGARRYEYLSIQTSKDKLHNKELLKIAQQVRNKKELELQSNNYNFIPEFKSRTSLKSYFQSIADQKGKSSLEQSSLKHLKDFVSKDIMFQEIDEVWLEKFKEYLLKKVSQNSAFFYFRVLRSVFNKAKRDKIILKNPAENVKNFQYKQSKIDFLGQREIELLAKSVCKAPEIKRAFLFSCFTGLRFSDIKALKWESIKGNQLEIKQIKTNDVLYLPLSTTALNLLSNGNKNVHHFPNQLVFEIHSRVYTNRILKEWFAAVGIKKNAHYHISRHTFATLSLTAGVDLYTVSKLLGHKNFKNTQVYANIIDEKKKQAIDNLPVVEVS
ncbi:MAG: site-specific integrase [Bacteroidetes bacterium]|nr:site-specific integrase [Bacteroidota bacterium]